METSFKISCMCSVLPFTETYPTDKIYMQYTCNTCKDNYARVVSEGLCVCVLGRVPLFATPWTIACQPLCPWRFSGQEYWSGLPFLPERVTGRKARGLQTEERGCKCQIFLSLLNGRRKQTSDMFFLLHTNLKGGFS